MPTSCYSYWAAHGEACNRATRRLAGCNERNCPFKKERGIITEDEMKDEEEKEKCEICGKEADSFRTASTSSGTEIQVCDDCCDDHVTCCDWCDEPYVSEAIRRGLCPSCYENSFTCDSCGGRFHNDDYGGDGMCTSCYEDHEDDCLDGIYEYHDYPTDWSFHHTKTDVNPTLYFGVELETDRYSDRHQCIENLSNELPSYEKFCYPSEDSSLSNGIEFVCQPATLKFHQEEFPWKKLTDIIAASGGKSHETQTCGLHIHFSKDFFGQEQEIKDLCQLKTVYIVSKFWEQFSVLARRKTHYAEPYNRECFDKLPADKVRGMLYGTEGSMSHYSSVNICPRHTIELRLFKGTLKHDTLLASIELTDYIANFVKDHKAKELKAITWQDFISGTDTTKYLYLPDYLKSHNLHAKSTGEVKFIKERD